MKQFIVFIFLTLFSHYSFSQSGPLRQITPKSPNVASLDKVLEAPVNLSTGKVNVSIPLYDIKIGEINLPISLNYNNNGLKADEIPSWVGLGWSLFSGGHISYNQKGFNDFSATKGLFSTGGLAQLTRYFNNQMSVSEKQSYFNDIAMGNIDAEYDEYYYSIPSESGSFHFISATNARFTPSTDLLAVRTANGFKITDDNGNVYLFESKELITREDPSSVSPDFNDNSAYYISKITAANGDIAEFKYKQYYLQYNTTTNQLIHSSFATSSCNPQSGSIKVVSTISRVNYLLPDSIKFPNGYVKFIHSGAFREDLKKISPTAAVPYLSSMNVYDINNLLVKQYSFNMSYFGTGSRLRLDKIEEKSGTLKSRVWTFLYYGQESVFPNLFSKNVDHWGYINDNGAGSYNFPQANYPNIVPNWRNYSAGYFQNRLGSFDASSKGLLKNISYPTGGSTEFQYEGNRIITNGTTENDNLGPFLGKPPQENIDKFIAGDRADIPQVIERSFVVPVDGNYMISTYSMVSPDPFYQSSQVLFTSGPSIANLNNQIISSCDSYQCSFYRQIVRLARGTYTYKVQGSSYVAREFPYDTKNLAAWIEVYGPGDVVRTTSFALGGNRIKKIINTDLLTNSKVVKNFIYNDSLSKVSFKQIPDYITQVERSYSIDGGPNCLSCGGSDYTIHENSTNSLIGNVIEYKTVTTLEDDNGLAGKTVQHFLTSENIGGAATALNTSWRSGSLRQEYQYSASSKPVSILENNFVIDHNNTQINGLKVSPLEICGPGSYLRFNVELATLISEKFKISSTVNKLYNTTEPVIQTANYSYDFINHNRSNSVANNTSNNVIKIKKVKYTFDYGNWNVANSGYAAGLKFLNGRHMNVPVEEIEIQNINGVQYVVSGILRTFKTNQSVPEQIHTLDVSTPIPLSNFTSSSINTAGTFIKDPRYAVRATYSLYDDFSNVLQQQYTNGPITSYIWSYKKQYPVAEVRNAVQADIAYAGFEAEGKGYWTYAGGTVVDATAPGGRRVYNLSGGALSKSGLTAAKQYTLSYWAKSTTATAISGGTATAIASRNGWTLYSRPLTGVTTVTLSGAVMIDEIRLHPLDAEMNTYTYDPLTGMTSATDPSGRTTYYSYDGFGRLQTVKDTQQKTKETFNYNYRNQ